MKIIFQQIAILSTTLILGCSTAYMNLRDTNRMSLPKLEVGMTPSQVSAIMGSEIVDGTSGKVGNPYKREIVSSAENVSYEVLYYYTDHVGNKHWETGMTPVIFKDGKLVGVGWSSFTQYGLKAPSQASSVVTNATPTNADTSPAESKSVAIDAADYGIHPSNYQEIVKAYFQGILKDPYSAQYRFSEPYKAYLRAAPIVGGNPKTFGYIAEVGVNAKNSYGGYTGEKQYRIFIRNGSVIDEVSPNSWFKERWYQ